MTICYKNKTTKNSVITNNYKNVFIMWSFHHFDYLSNGMIKTFQLKEYYVLYKQVENRKFSSISSINLLNRM